YRLIADNAGDVIFTLDLNLKYTYVSPSVYKLRGLTQEELINRNIKETLTPKSMEMVLTLISEQLEIQKESNHDPVVIELEMISKDGKVLWTEVKASFLRNRDGNISGILGVTRNITERKRTEEKLRLTQYSINNIADSIFWIDRYANFLFVNSAACKNLGYSQEELLKMNIFDVDPVFDKEKLEDHWEKISKPGEFVVIETTHLTKDGRKIPVEVTSNLLEYEGKQYNIAVARDITIRKQSEAKQKELEATNRRLQKAESLSQMAGGIAHLFNNYLYVVTGNLELALEELSKESLIRENLFEALKAARRCADVSGSMLTYLGQIIVQRESIDITEFCRTNLPQLQLLVHKGIAIDGNLTDNQFIVSANAGQMQQILNNLIINASESIGKNKGRIVLATKIMSAYDILQFNILPVDCKPSEDIYACIEVTDTGCGIPEKNIYKLFDPFFTTKFTGRGLGLAVVLGIVKTWGGMIGVRSEEGYGSSFMVFLPLSVKNTVQQSIEPAQKQQRNSCFTVLLVEDHEMVRNMTKTMLKRIGFEVITTVNGFEAIDMFKQHKDSICCLITDLSMPELDGWATLAEIKKINPDIPAILASGYDEAFAMSGDNKEKPHAFLHKPYSMTDLKRALEQALKG
ncbi:MAG: PAS domain S-box protein, partial [Desulfamplus sp.]|nr:PAS domain S-box protein [Desulfamplus sp.]